MPRIINRQKRLSTSVRAERAAIKRYRKGKYIDPYPWIQGTLPEKIIYAELSKRGIRFAFQNEIEFAIPEIDLSKIYRPDIAIPEMKIVIEVQGSYWHSTEEAITNDAYKFAVYETAGWKVLVWWDYQIFDDVASLFAAEPLLGSRPPINTNSAPTEYIYTKKRTIDDSKGIRTLNYKRAQRVAYKKDAPRLKLKRTSGRKYKSLF